MKAIALSGGGDKGAFTVGVLKKLHEQGNSYDLLSGTSTGSLITPLLAVGAIGLLEKIYTSVSKDDILRRGNIFRGSFYDTTPLKNLIASNFTQDVFDGIQSRIYISAVCMNNKVLTYYTNDKDLKGCKKYDVEYIFDRDDLIESVYASCLQPVIMNTADIRGKAYCDGGLKEYVPIDCLIDAGAEDITAILTTTGDRHYEEVPERIDLKLLNAIGIFSGDVATNDLRLAQLYNDGINYIQECKDSVQRSTGLTDMDIEVLFTSYRNPFYEKKKLDLKIIRPDIELGGGLDFDTEKMKMMFKHGYKILTLK